MTELDVLYDVVNRLDKAGLAYMLTGSMAMNYYAVPRMTRDIDLIVELEKVDAARVYSIFSDDYYISEVAIKEAVNHQSSFNIIHNRAIIKIDMIVRKHSEFRVVEFERRKRVKIDGFEVCIVSIEDLIISKLKWAEDSRSKTQMSDVNNLLSGDYDKEYLDYWLAELEIGEW
ncbi:MAG: nucleotidyltransferase [Saprospiraceae bacterium]|nr:nucleotidyltransferase [Saprospiraceae bacterium]